jgi:hypothetical protein
MTRFGGCAHLAACGDVPVDGIDIGTAITRITHELPAAEDIDHITQRLNARQMTLRNIG